MKRLFQLRKIEYLLVSNRLRDLEEWLKEKSEKDPSLLVHLTLYYRESAKSEEAINCAEKYVLRNDSPLSRFVYYETLSLFQPKRLEEEKRLLRRLSSKDENYTTFCLALIDLFSEHRNLARGRFKRCVESGYSLGYWGLARLNNDSWEAIEHLKSLKKSAPSFPVIWKDLGLYYLQVGKELLSLKYLWKYLKKMPLDTRAQYEFALALLKYCHMPLMGRWFARKVAKSLAIKASLDPANSENLWIYRFLALYCAWRGKFHHTARWVLMEKNLLHQLLSGINSRISKLNKIPQEEVVDMLSSIREILAEKEIIDPEEFAKTYARIRETRLLEEMLRLSEERNKQENRNKVD